MTHHTTRETQVTARTVVAPGRFPAWIGETAKTPVAGPAFATLEAS